MRYYKIEFTIENGKFDSKVIERVIDDGPACTLPQYWNKPMKYYRIEFTINADGIVTEKVIATGPNCTAVTEGIEAAIGEVQSQEFLPQYNQPEIEQSQDETLWAN